MQNKSFLYILLVTSIFGHAPCALAQEFLAPTPDDAKEAAAPTLELPALDTPQEADSIAQEVAITPDISGKEPVDFPPRSSMGTMELPPLPGVFETPVTGPAPLTPSVSSKDLPSEQLLGRLNPDVFQELAELERDNVFLKLQLAKQDNQQKLEEARARYRKERLEEISKREELIRARITWWQQQEAERLRLDKERAEIENLKALEDMKDRPLIPDAPANNNDDNDALILNPTLQKPAPIPGAAAPAQDEEDQPQMGSAYQLLAVQGTRGNLTATIRNSDTDKISIVRVGDTLKTGDVITNILPTQVVMSFQGNEYVITFEDN